MASLERVPGIPPQDCLERREKTRELVLLRAPRRGAGAVGRSVARTVGGGRLAAVLLVALLSGCAGPDGSFAPPPEPIVTDPPGALDDLGWVPYRILLFADRNHDGVLNAAEQREVRARVLARERCEDSWVVCF